MRVAVTASNKNVDQHRDLVTDTCGVRAACFDYYDHAGNNVHVGDDDHHSYRHHHHADHDDRTNDHYDSHDHDNSHDHNNSFVDRLASVQRRLQHLQPVAVV